MPDALVMDFDDAYPMPWRVKVEPQMSMITDRPTGYVYTTVVDASGAQVTSDENLDPRVAARFAAAPDLLAACKALVAWVDAPSSQAEPKDVLVALAIFGQIRAAVTKAEPEPEPPKEA